MHESYNTAITLWPAASLPASVARELHSVGVDLDAQQVNGGSFTVWRTPDGIVGVNLSFESCRYGLTDLEAVLAMLRLARISYLARDTQNGQLVGDGRAFDPATGIERVFTVIANGTPVITADDLEIFEGRYNTAEALLEALKVWLTLPTPANATEITREELVIVTVPDDEDLPEASEILGEIDGPPGACLRIEREEAR